MAKDDKASDYPKNESSAQLDSKFRLILVAAERSKQLRRGARPRVDIDARRHKPIRIALEEIVRGEVDFKIINQQDVSPSPQKLSPEQEYVALALIEDRIKLVSLTPDGHYKYLDDIHNLHDFIYVTSPEASALEDAVDELESLVNNQNSKEKDFQDFFSRNKDFILNDEYKNAHPHVVLTRDRGDSLIPDFVLEPIDQSSLCDLLELKLPSAQIFNLKKNRMRYSAAVAEACAQLREYGRFFEEERNRKFVLENYGLRAYKPKMFVIIGRRGNVDAMEVRNMETDYSNLYLRTYDDIINRMKWRIKKLKGKVKKSNGAI